MNTGQLGRWTRYFTSASGFTLIIVHASALVGAGRRFIAILAVFGFICPMIFGMAYLLLPSLIGRTLVHQRLPGLHFLVAYLGATLIVADQLLDLDTWVFIAGSGLWSLGVGFFIGELLYTILPAVLNRPGVILRSAELPQRSTRLATTMIPIALGYLVVGTVSLLGRIDGISSIVPATIPSLIHYHAAGLGAVLIIALGARLMPGFFHVTPPHWATWIVLLAAGIGPALLATHFSSGPWFRLGAVLEAVALIGYALLVGYVYWVSEWRRISFNGILLGAIGGMVAVSIGLLIAVDGATIARLTAHATLIISGFFALTIVGYAYQFFPVTAGDFLGSSSRVALMTIGALFLGAIFQSTGPLTRTPILTQAGAFIGLIGASGYWYLITRRFLND